MSETTPKPTVDVSGTVFSWPKNPMRESLEKSYVSDMMRSREYEVINRLITKICSQEILDFEEITCCGLNPRKAIEVLKILFRSCPNIIQNTEELLYTSGSHVYEYYLYKNGELYRKRKAIKKRKLEELEELEKPRSRSMTPCKQHDAFIDAELHLQEKTN